MTSRTETFRTAFGVEWGVDETAERLILAKRIEPIIVVGYHPVTIARDTLRRSWPRLDTATFEALAT